MRKMIKVESGSFAALVRSYKKSLNMLAVLQHICEDNCVELSMLPDEVCELINLDPAEIEKQRLSGWLRFAEVAFFPLQANLGYFFSSLSQILLVQTRMRKSDRGPDFHIVIPCPGIPVDCGKPVAEYLHVV